MRLMSHVVSYKSNNVDVMKKIHFEIGETAVTVISEEEYTRVAKDAIFEARDIILSKIRDDPFFKTTFDPYLFKEGDDDLIKRMCVASMLAGVGPMAGVAGAVSVHAVEAMRSAGAEYAVVDNGGDIALSVDRDIRIGMFTDNEGLRDLAFLIHGTGGAVTGVCSSSGRIGPSVSFGTSSISTVFSDDVILADACATALGNMIVEGDDKNLSASVEAIGGIHGVKGCLVCCGEKIAVYGDVPEFVNAKIDDSCITRIILPE